MKDVINVAFVGNPNCGKTTLFNAYTGAKLKVANWPGVTVERKEGSYTYEGQKMNLVDLPGIYSLTSYTMEEKVSRKEVLGDDVDIIIDVVDASSLERNLYLALQLIELGKPVVMALNMMDIIEERGMEIDLHRLPEMLGIPVIPVSARKRSGLDILMHAVCHHASQEQNDTIRHHHSEGNHIHHHHKEYAMVYSDEIEDKIDELKSRAVEKYPDFPNHRWLALKSLEYDEEILEKFPLDVKTVIEKSLETEIVNQKFGFIEEIFNEVLVNKDKQTRLTDKIDAVLTHPFWGVPSFLLIIAAVFFLTFTVGDFLKGYLQSGLELLSGTVLSGLQYIGVSDWLISLVVDGILAGVGGILTFLPNIIILFLALAFLEDSGYMSRVAYVMDSLMSRLGLSGRAFLPMLLGFGCSVPAVMASRALEDKNDRVRTILATPYMSCSARLPVYVLLSETFFPKNAMLAAYSMYLIGIITAILVAKFAKVSKEPKKTNTLLIELPEYKTPNSHTIAIYVWDKVKDYLTKAGTTIFIASIILWALLNFGANGMTDSIDNSFAASIGRFIAPVFEPCGLGYWQIIVALISGLAAKEVVVSSLSVLFSIGNIMSADGMASLADSLGALGFTAVNGYALMLFCLLYVPCIATIATIKRETKSLKITWLSVGLHLLIAWAVSALFFQIASLIA